MSVTLMILYILHVYRSAIQGMGNTIVPMIAGIMECVGRISVALLLTREQCSPAGHIAYWWL